MCLHELLFIDLQGKKAHFPIVLVRSWCSIGSNILSEFNAVRGGKLIVSKPHIKVEQCEELLSLWTRLALRRNSVPKTGHRVDSNTLGQPKEKTFHWEAHGLFKKQITVYCISSTEPPWKQSPTEMTAYQPGADKDRTAENFHPFSQGKLEC